jgi:hypothetical protein
LADSLLCSGSEVCDEPVEHLSDPGRFISALFRAVQALCLDAA